MASAFRRFGYVSVDVLTFLPSTCAQAESLGIDTSVPTPRLSARGGRGRFRGGSLSSGRGKGVRTFKLDNRTKRLRISQLSVEVTIDVLRSHFEASSFLLSISPLATLGC